MKNCPHCGHLLEDEDKTGPIREPRFVSHYRWVCRSPAGEIYDEVAPFTGFHAALAGTVLHEQGLPIEQAEKLIDAWNKRGNLGDRQYTYTLTQENPT